MDVSFFSKPLSQLEWRDNKKSCHLLEKKGAHPMRMHDKNTTCNRSNQNAGFLDTTNTTCHRSNQNARLPDTHSGSTNSHPATPDITKTMCYQSVAQCWKAFLVYSSPPLLETRMHSSRMHTGCSLTVCCSLLPGGCLLWEGVCSRRVWSWGVWSRGVYSGVSAPGGYQLWCVFLHYWQLMWPFFKYHSSSLALWCYLVCLGPGCSPCVWFNSKCNCLCCRIPLNHRLSSQDDIQKIPDTFWNVNFHLRHWLGF